MLIPNSNSTLSLSTLFAILGTTVRMIEISSKHVQRGKSFPGERSKESFSRTEGRRISMDAARRVGDTLMRVRGLFLQRTFSFSTLLLENIFSYLSALDAVCLFLKLRQFLSYILLQDCSYLLKCVSIAS